ncbi:MAG: DUF4007 family protein [Elainellaceae cyanobacterium]
MDKQTTLALDGVRSPRAAVFARHETFHPRFGWLKKGFDRASHDPSVFLAKDATVQLGVGKNMVRSLRYWCDAFKLLEDDQPTAFGKDLLGQTGWDPYLEDPASLWLLHWQLLQPPCSATAWDFTFNYFNRVDFTYEDLLYALSEYRDRQATRIADSSIKKDASCILRMYAGQNAKSSVGEDSLDCPFTELRLIQTAGDSRHYSFRIGPKQNLPAEIIAYTALIFAHRTYPTARTIPIANLLYDVGSPGFIFRLNESTICDAIEAMRDPFQELSLTDAAGKMQLSFFTHDAEDLALDILKNYYDERSLAA